MFTVNIFDEEEISISAKDQYWEDKDYKELLKYDIIYERGIVALWIEKRKKAEPLVHIMGEDDGHLYWLKRTDKRFSYSWIDNYMSILNKTKEYVNNHKKKYNI